MNTTPERIIVATDFSSTGERAQDVALNLARKLGAELHVLHVRVLLDDPHLEDEHQSELQRLLSASDVQKRQALEAPAAAANIPVHTHLIRGISAAEVIVETCSDVGCDLIVMGTHGRRGLTHLLLGSVAENVVRTAPVPVLTVRPEAALPADGFRKILVPHDFSEHSTVALRVAAAWALELEAAVTIVHAVEPVVYPEFYAVDLLPDEMIRRLKSRSEEALAATAADLLEGVDARVEVRVGRAGDTIVAEAQPQKHDLVIMGTRGLSAIEHLLLGSVAENVLRRCALPLLAVRGEVEKRKPKSADV
jgi:nucleotide-binding universal stress UspA family protein